MIYRKLLYTIMLLVIATMFWIPVIKYTYAKTIGKWKEDCMIVYINKYYPHGSMYLIDWKYLHVDTGWIEYLQKTGDFDWCNLYGDTIRTKVFNIPYCYNTLILEKIF